MGARRCFPEAEPFRNLADNCKTSREWPNLFKKARHSFPEGVLYGYITSKIGAECALISIVTPVFYARP